MDAFTVAWIVWALGFGVVEGLAIARHEGGATLSEHLRLWFSTKARGRAWFWRRLLLAVFCVWFCYHIFVDGPGPL